MTQKLAVPWKVEGFVLSWKNASPFPPEQRDFLLKWLEYCYCWKKTISGNIHEHVITVYKSQGSNVGYMQHDLIWSIAKKTPKEKDYQQPIFQSQFYALLSRAKSRDKVLLLNFDPEDIKLNESILEEMFRMREESLFSWQDSLI